MRSTPTIRLTLLLTLCVLSTLFGSIQALGQTIDASNSQSLELRVANLEQQYDAQIIQILSNYFNRKKFFVDVNINAEMIDEPFGPSQTQVIRENSRQNLFMPGLPFLPEDNLRQPEALSNTPQTIVNQNTIKTLRLVNMSVNIYADTSLTVDQLELMRFITSIAVKVNQNRGDEIIISQLAIPDYTERPEPITAASITPPPASFYDSLVTYIPGIVLMMLFGLTILFSRLINKPQQIVPVRDYRNLFKDELTADVKAQDEIAETEVEAAAHTAPADILEPNDLVSRFFNEPEEVATIFRYWLAEQDGGAKRAAKVLAALDRSLLRTLKGALHPEDYETLSDALVETKEPDLNEKTSIFTEFSAMLNIGAKESVSAQKRNKFSLFKFLDHISKHHIITLLETEDPISGAFILHYIPDDEAADLIKKVDKDVAAPIMLHLASLNKLSNDEQHRIAGELFEKAMDLVEAERSEQYGAEHLIPILERLPIFEQKRYIDEMKAQGSIVGAILEKQFITIEKIPDLDDSIIQRAVRTLKTEVLLDAIVGLDSSIVDKILSARPKREQRLLRLELDEMRNTPLPKTEYAKVLLMNYVRRNASEY